MTPEYVEQCLGLLHVERLNQGLVSSILETFCFSLTLKKYWTDFLLPLKDSVL